MKHQPGYSLQHTSGSLWLGWLLVALLAVALTGCGGDGSGEAVDADGDMDVEVADGGDMDADDASDGDGASDTGGDVSDTDMSDAEPDTGADQDMEIDVPEEVSLEGTSLEGIEVTWTEPAELCHLWDEQGQVETQLERRAELVLPPQPRSLEWSALRNPRLEDVVAARGVLQGERWFLESPASQLVAYEVINPDGDTRLEARVRHNLGDGGQLDEIYTVQRQRGDSDPVSVDDRTEYGEVRWEYVPTGWTEAPIRLGHCDGPDGTERAISIAVAEYQGEMLAVTRFTRTRLTDAGSSPVWWRSARIVSSAQPYQARDVFGSLALVYSAAHHNWNDDSHIDLTSDVNSYFQRLSEDAPEGRYVQNIQYVSDLNQSSALDVTWLDTASGSVETERWSVVTAAYRVDITSLGRSCTDGDAFYLGSAGTFSSGVQLTVVDCDGASPFMPDQIAVLEYPEDLTVVGEVYDSKDMSPVTVNGESGVEVALSNGHTLQITPFGQQDYRVYAEDGNGDSVTEVLASPAAEHWIEPRDQTILAESGDGGVSVEIKRRWAAQGAGFSAIYSPVSIRVDAGGETWFVDAFDALEYTNTHHNWADGLVATQADGTEIRWEVSDAGTAQSVQVTGPAGEELVAETELIPMS